MQDSRGAFLLRGFGENSSALQSICPAIGDYRWTWEIVILFREEGKIDREWTRMNAD